MNGNGYGVFGIDPITGASSRKAPQGPLSWELPQGISIVPQGTIAGSIARKLRPEPGVHYPVPVGRPVANGGGQMAIAELSQRSLQIQQQLAGMQPGQEIQQLGIPPVTGLPGWLAGIAGGAVAAYGAAQAIGVQFPWETGAGEGFIAPWSRDIVQDETGQWVTRGTRPDLFGGAAPGTALAVAGGAVGAQVVKQWDTGYTDAQGAYHPGWPFAMTSDGKIHTVTKAGVRKSWRPYKSVVLGKNPSPRQLSRAAAKFNQFDKLHTKIKGIVRKFKT